MDDDSIMITEENREKIIEHLKNEFKINQDYNSFWEKDVEEDELSEIYDLLY